MREAFSLMGIPLTIGPSLTALVSLASKDQDDVLGIIAKVRNDFVLAKRNLPKVNGAIAQALNLAQHCIELMLLRSCDYRGVHSNRIRGRWGGQVKKIPSTA